MLAAPGYIPSEDSLYGGDPNRSHVVGGVPLTGRTTAVGRGKDVYNPVLEGMPVSTSRRQSEWHIDRNGVIHADNVGSNEMTIFTGPNAGRAQSRSGTESGVPTETQVVAEVSGPPVSLSEQVDRIADPTQREEAKKWLDAKTKTETALAEERKRQEGFLQEAIKSGHITTHEQLAARRASIDRQLARGIRVDHLYSGSHDRKYEGWQAHYLTVSGGGDVMIDYDEPEQSEFTLAGKPHTPGKFVLHRNPFPTR